MGLILVIHFPKGHFRLLLSFGKPLNYPIFLTSTARYITSENFKLTKNTKIRLLSMPTSILQSFSAIPQAELKLWQQRWFVTILEVLQVHLFTSWVSMLIISISLKIWWREFQNNKIWSFNLPIAQDWLCKFIAK